MSGHKSTLMPATFMAANEVSGEVFCVPIGEGGMD